MISDLPVPPETSAMAAPVPALGGVLALGPCGEPCEHPCDSPCDDPKGGAGRESRWAKWLKGSLFNTLDLCFDDVYAEPKKILIVGGSRQMAWSQHVALLLPAAEIVLIDPDPAVTAKAQEEICCRFKFVTAPLEALPFERDAFDLTLAHNFLAYPQQWEKALGEISRVTAGNLFLSVHRPLLWKLARRLTGVCRAMAELGAVPPAEIPTSFALLSALTRHAKIKSKLSPFPWAVFMAQVRPKWEEKLVLAS